MPTKPSTLLAQGKMGHRWCARQQVQSTMVDGDIGGGIVWVCDWEGFANALVATANATATAVVAVTIAAADKSMTAPSQPRHDNKTATLLYSHQGWMDKKDRNESCGSRREMALLLQTSTVGRILAHACISFPPKRKKIAFTQAHILNFGKSGIGYYSGAIPKLLFCL
jgi:hypothetical protein